MPFKDKFILPKDTMLNPKLDLFEKLPSKVYDNLIFKEAWKLVTSKHFLRHCFLSRSIQFPNFFFVYSPTRVRQLLTNKFKKRLVPHCL